MITVYTPGLPCGRPAVECGSTEPHDAHDWNLPGSTHAGWHCWGFSITPSGQRVGWAGGTEVPGDAMDRCQNHPGT